MQDDINCYLGYSTNQDIRYNASSGGIVSGTLIYLLESGEIDGAIVTRQRSNPYIKELYIAETAEEIMNARGSWYGPVHTRSVMQEVKKRSGKYALVGVPCQMGIMKANQDKIPFAISLFCGHSLTIEGIKYLLIHSGINPDEVQNIKWRGEGWPGRIRITTHSKMEKEIPRDIFGFVFNSGLFTPNKCLRCKLFSSCISDLSVGDPWIPEVIASEKIGCSVIIAQTEKGKAVITDMENHGLLRMKSIDIERVIQSQYQNFHKTRPFFGGLGTKYYSIFKYVPVKVLNLLTKVM